MQHDADGRTIGAVWKTDGKQVEYGGVGKMGKTENNGVDPQTLIDRFGADTARLYVMFAGKPEDSAVWSDAGVEGASRFLKRLWMFAHTHAEEFQSSGRPAPRSEATRAARRDIHLALKQANFDYRRTQYNTVVSAGMKMLNTLEEIADDQHAASVRREGLSILLRVLYPVIPHTAWTLWRDLGFDRDLGDVVDAPWPSGSCCK